MFQHHGESVFVGACLLHQVINVRPNFKIAYETWVLKDIPRYMHTWTKTHSKRGAKDMKDYMRTMRLVVEAIAGYETRYQAWVAEQRR